VRMLDSFDDLDKPEGEQANPMAPSEPGSGQGTRGLLDMNSKG